MNFSRIAILGATDFGGQLAAALVNLGYRVFLYDRPHSEEANFYAQKRINELIQAHPFPTISVNDSQSIVPRNYRNSWDQLSHHDLLIDCSEDNLQVKRALWTRLTPALRENHMLLSVSQGIPAEEIATALPDRLKNRFFAVNFACPLIEKMLVEIVPHERSNAELLEQLYDFFKKHLNRQVIITKDHANYASTRLAYFVLSNAYFHAERLKLTPDELEELTGSLIGRHEHTAGKMVRSFGLANMSVFFSRTSKTDKHLFSSLGQFPLTMGGLAKDKVEIDGALKTDILHSSWKNIAHNFHPHAQFIHAHLLDCFQYGEYLGHHISQDDLEKIQRYGFGWSETMRDQIARFGAVEINASEPKITIKNRRRSRKSLTNMNPFNAEKIQQNKSSRLYIFQGKALIWQPNNPEFLLNFQLLSELLEATNAAKQQSLPLMIFHHGQHRERKILWRDATQKKLIETEIALLREVIIAMKMLPYPIMTSITGDLYDYETSLTMQSDYVLCDASTMFTLSAIQENLIPFGGFLLEWLRRLPVIDGESHRAKIHAIICQTLKHGSFNSRLAQQLGILRLHDSILSPALMIQETLRALDELKEHRRVLRYSIPSLTPVQIDQLIQRANESQSPSLYKKMVNLLTEESSRILSLSNYLERENATFLESLT